MKRIYGIGNALVDITANVDDDFLTQAGVEKGHMTLVDKKRSEFLLSALKDHNIDLTVTSGGSVANSIAGIAAIEKRNGRTDSVGTAFFGRVGDDEYGDFFINDMRDSGALMSRELSVAHGELTARSIILVTPDGERSMNTYLGASAGFGLDNVDLAVIRHHDYGIFEGYLADTDHGRELIETLTPLSRFAVTLSDPGCIERNRYFFYDMMVAGQPLVFGNKKEWTAFGYEHRSDAYWSAEFAGIEKGIGKDMPDQISAELLGLAFGAAISGNAICTRGGDSVILGLGTSTYNHPCIEFIPVQEVKPLDTTGAGDAFLAGTVSALFNGEKVLGECVKVGSQYSSEVLMEKGARISPVEPQQDPPHP